MIGNNAELMSYEKSGWCLIEELTSGSDQTIYLGKPLRNDAATDQDLWVIKRISIIDNGAIRNTEIKYANGYNRWDARASLEYSYLIESK